MKEILGKNRKFILLTMAGVLFTSLTALIAPMMIQHLDITRSADSLQLLATIFGGMSISFLLQLLLVNYRENYAASFNLSYLRRLLTKLSGLNYDQLANKEPSYLINRVFTAVDALYLFMIGSLPTLGKTVALLTLSLGLMFLISWKLALLMITLIPINYFGFRLINRRLGEKMAAMQQQGAIAHRDLLMAFSNIDALKAGANQKLITTLLDTSLANHYKALAKTNQFAQTTSLSLDFIKQVIQNFVYIINGLLVATGELPVSRLLMVSILLPLFFTSLSDLTKANLDFKTLTTANDFIHLDLDAHQERQQSGVVNKITEINFCHPHFRLQEELLTFPIELTLQAGDVVYLKGPSGSGKSSLLKCLLAFRETDGITIDHQPIASLNQRQLRQRICYLPQTSPIFTMTLAENITGGRQLTAAEEEKLLQSKILEPILHSKHWQTILTENGANLSGGERQRIAAARMLLIDADLYLLDEATSQIDQTSAQEILQELLKNKQDRIVIFTSHDTMNEKLANKVIQL